MKLKKTISIIGQISSGKTSLAKKLSQEYNVPVASFGEYLKYYCTQNNIRIESRKTLQDIGQHMIDENALHFLKDVINFTKPNDGKIIFEGVRHRIILQAIINLSLSRKVIYINVSYEQRLKRFLARKSEWGIESNENDFFLASSHPVELEIPTLKAESSLVLDSKESVKHDFVQIKSFLEDWLLT